MAEIYLQNMHITQRRFKRQTQISENSPTELQIHKGTIKCCVWSFQFLCHEPWEYHWCSYRVKSSIIQFYFWCCYSSEWITSCPLQFFWLIHKRLQTVTKEMTYNFLQNGSLHILKAISTNEEIKAAGLHKNNNQKYLIKERRRLFFLCRAHNPCVQTLGWSGGKNRQRHRKQLPLWKL